MKMKVIQSRSEPDLNYALGVYTAIG